MVFWMAFLASTQQPDIMKKKRYWSKSLRHVNIGNLIKRNNKHAHYFDEQGHLVNQDKHVDWDEYSKVLLKPFSHQKETVHKQDAIGKDDNALSAFFELVYTTVSTTVLHSLRNR